MAVSPSPADAVLACGGTLAGLAAGGWQVTLVTVFGAAEDDAAAAERLGLADVAALGLPQGAPAEHVVAQLGPVLDAAQTDRILAPLALDPGAAEAVVADALGWLRHPAPVVRWRDPSSPPGPRRLPDEQGIPIAAHLGRKLDACAAYGGRVSEAFGGEAAMRAALAAFHEAEGRRLGVEGPAEALVEPPPDPRRERARREQARRDELVALARLRSQLDRS